MKKLFYLMIILLTSSCHSNDPIEHNVTTEIGKQSEFLLLFENGTQYPEKEQLMWYMDFIMIYKGDTCDYFNIRDISPYSQNYHNPKCKYCQKRTELLIKKIIKNYEKGS